MDWINVKTQLPVDGQELYYFSPILGLWKGKYKYSPTTHSVDAEGNQHPISEKLAALISPHVFIGGGGCCDTDEVTHWQPYDEQRAAQGWVPLPPMYAPPEMEDLRDFHDDGEAEFVRQNQVTLKEMQAATRAAQADDYVMSEAEAAALSPDAPKNRPTVEPKKLCVAPSPDTSWLDAQQLMVDPPSGWLYGFPKVWDKLQHPDMTQWLIDNGYPEAEAKSGLPVRFMPVLENESGRV
jgi:hypothetical protein